jgi:hypothetical protein
MDTASSQQHQECLARPLKEGKREIIWKAQPEDTIVEGWVEKIEAGDEVRENKKTAMRASTFF